MRAKLLVISIVLHFFFLGGVYAHSAWGIHFVSLPQPEQVPYAAMLQTETPTEIQKPDERAPGAIKSGVRGTELGTSDKETAQLAILGESDSIGPAKYGNALIDGPPNQGNCLLSPEKCKTKTSVGGIGTKRPEIPVVAENVLMARYLRGNQDIKPSRVDKLAIARSGKSRLFGRMKLCINKSGRVYKSSVAQSTGYPNYDSRLLSEMRKWEFEPFTVGDKVTAACTYVVIRYHQRRAPGFR